MASAPGAGACGLPRWACTRSAASRRARPATSSTRVAIHGREARRVTHAIVSGAASRGVVDCAGTCHSARVAAITPCASPSSDQASRASGPPTSSPAPITSSCSSVSPGWAGTRTRTTLPSLAAFSRSTPGSWCSTSGPTPISSGCSTSSASRRTPATCVSACGAGAAASSTPASPSRRSLAQRWRVLDPRHLGMLVEIVRYFRCRAPLPVVHRGLRPDAWRVPGSRGVLAASQATLRPAHGRRHLVGVVCRHAWTRRRARSCSSTRTTACSPPRAPRRGARSPAAAGRTSRPSPARCPAPSTLDTGRSESSGSPTASKSHTGGGTVRRFDCVVIATHADTALALLADPSPAEEEALGRLPLLGQPHGAAHRCLGAAARRGGPGRPGTATSMTASDSIGPCLADLPPESPAGRPRRHAVLRHPERARRADGAGPRDDGLHASCARPTRP